MADKEATVYVVDVGKSMGGKNHGRKETDLEWAMQYVWDKIATAISTGRKTLCSGVVAFRTDETHHQLDEDDEYYQHICVLHEIGQMLMPGVRGISQKIKPSSTDVGDAISAIVVAVDMIEKFCKKLKYIRRIVVVTNGEGLMDSDMLSAIASKINADGIELVVLGADFDDPEFGLKEEDKSDLKASNEKVLKQLTDECGGIFGTLEQAVTELGIPRIKPVRPVHSYRGYLTLGNPDQYKTAMCIDVERYPYTSVMKPPTASNFVIKSTMAMEDPQAAASTGEAMDGVEQNGLASVHNTRSYQVKDETAPGGKRDVDRDDLAKGYEYGRTAVPISASEETVTQLETKAGLEIVGFVPKENYKHFMSMSKSNIIIPQRTNEKAVMAMSSFINALYELESYAIARLVVKDGKEPLLVLLAWHDLTEYQCLYEVELPFAEDVRSYKFPPLDRIVTLSGKVLKEHRNLPSDAVIEAMDAYVDAMDLTTYGKDDEGNSTEYLPLDENYSSLLHRINQVIRYRAVHPNAEVPPPHDILLRPTKPPAELLEKAGPVLKTLRDAVDVKKVPPKTLSRRRGARAPEKPLSGLDISALLANHRPQQPGNGAGTDASADKGPLKISARNAIPEFRQTLEAADAIDTISDAAQQLAGIIEEWVKHSLGNANYDRAIEAMRVLREGCVEMELPGAWNDWLRDFKTRVLNEDVGGDRREFWFKVRGARLGLVEKKVCPNSEVDEEEARAFLSTMK